MLEGQLTLTGVQVPTVREIYEPILTGLDPMGIVFRERVVSADETA